MTLQKRSLEFISTRDDVENIHVADGESQGIFDLENCKLGTEAMQLSKGLALERSAVWADGSMKSESGTYALILQSRQETKVQIGRWRQIEVEQGYYVYVGSAFGPGGVRSRVARHYRSDKPLRWHIDYLREHLIPLAAWYSHEPDRLEHRWAHVFRHMGDMVPIEGFGCSDCKCYTHLFRTSEPPDLVRFSCAAGRWA